MRIHPSHILVYYIILPYDYNLYLPRGGDLVHTARDLVVTTHLTDWYITVLAANWHVRLSVPCAPLE